MALQLAERRHKMIPNSATKYCCTVALLLLAACEEQETSRQQSPSTRPELKLDLSSFRFVVEQGRKTYYQSRNYIESGGIGVTLTRGKVCVENGKNCVESAVRYRVEAGKVLTQPNHKVTTILNKDNITIEYWGTADNGEPVNIKRTEKTSGAKVTVQ